MSAPQASSTPSELEPAPASLFLGLLLLAGSAYQGWRCLGDDGGWTSGLMATLMGAAGLALLVRRWRRRRKLQPYLGAELLTTPDPVVCGKPFDVRIVLPEQPGAAGAMRLHLRQRHVERSSSWPESHLAWEHIVETTPVPLPDGRWRIQARCQLPADAPGSGFYRKALQVTWQLQVRDAQDAECLLYELQVRADPAGLAPLGEPLHTEKPVGDRAGLKAPTRQPNAWTEREDARGWTLRFARPAPRTLAMVILVIMGFVVWPPVKAWWGGSDATPLAHWISNTYRDEAVRLLGLLLLLVHTATLRWVLRVDDDGLLLDRSSWLWPRRRRFRPAALDTLTRMSVDADPNDPSQDFMRLLVRSADGAQHWLTPRVKGESSAQVLAVRIRRALQQRGARFAPGERPTRLSNGPRLLALLLWLAWAALVLGGPFGLSLPGR